MAVIENKFVCDLLKPVQAQALKGNVFSLDNLGSRISVLIYENGQPTTISGSITANCILPDGEGSTVNVNGGLTTENGGSKAYVDIPQSCLLIPGVLKIAIKCTSSGVITTLAAIVANVYMTKTDNVITPSQQIINDWNEEISAAIATQNATIASQGQQITDIKSAITQFGCVEIPYTKNQYCNLSSSPITLSDGKPVGVNTTDNVQWGYISCQPGDRFTVSGQGYNNARLWAFVALDGTILLKSSSGITETEKIVIAPAGATLFITNTYNTGVSFKGLTYSRKDKYVQNPVNLFDPDYFVKNANSNDFSTLTVSKTGVTLTAASAGSNRKIYTYLKLKANTEYIFRVQKHTTAGLGFIQADESSDGGKTYSSSPVISLLSSSSYDDRLYETTFTTTTGDIRINFYVSGSTSATGSIVYSNIMLCEKANDPGFFVPYVTADDYYAQGLLKNMPAEMDYALDKTGYIAIQKSDIIQGSYSRDGSVVTNSTRIRLKNLTPISVGDKIIFSPGTRANQMLIAFVNNNMYIVETSYFSTATEYTSTISGFVMLLFKHRVGSSDVDVTPDEYDASVRIEYATQFDCGKEKYNGEMFRINYADAIPYPEQKANTYSVSYTDIIAKYDSIKERITSLYSDVATNVPKPITVTKTNLQLTDSGYQMYKYTFTPAYPEKTVYIIAGTHGNEYEGIYCLYNMVKAIYTDMYGYPQLREFRDKVKLVLIPVVNPYGFEHNCKKNGDGQNIYEQYNDGTTQSKEIISVKSVFSSETIDYFMDMHTDPYNSTSSKNCYGFALVDSVTYPVLYKEIMRFRDIIYNEFNMQSKYISDGKDIIVGRISSINGNNSVSYAERNNIPANVVEVSTGFGWGGYDDDFDHYVPPNYPSFADYGSSDMVRICTDFYTNVLLDMCGKLLGV